jgi:hypothetical protein
LKHGFPEALWKGQGERKRRMPHDAFGSFFAAFPFVALEVWQVSGTCWRTVPARAKKADDWELAKVGEARTKRAPFSESLLPSAHRCGHCIP